MTSICIFGSTARNRFDSLSDRDILVVTSSEAELNDASSYWTSAGWSVASFTNEQIVGMAARGFMFLQHIKQEGCIIKDDEHFLATVVETFRPKQNYEEEIFDSWTLLNDISRPSLAYWPALCSADIAFGAIRNIAILRLASRRRYTFDYSDLIDHFANEKQISPIRLHALHELRALKHGYRNRVGTLTPWPILDNALRGAEDLFGHFNPEMAKGANSVYRKLRILELDLVLKAGAPYWDQLPPHDTLASAWAYIRDPRGYPKDKLVDASWIAGIRRLAEARFSERQARRAD